MALVIPFSWGAATNLGLVRSDIALVDAQRVILQNGTVEITLATLVAALALAAVFFNRDAGLTETGGVDAWILYATFALTISPVFPELAGNTLAQEPINFVSFLIQSTGFMMISYAN